MNRKKRIPSYCFRINNTQSFIENYTNIKRTMRFKGDDTIIDIPYGDGLIVYHKSSNQYLKNI